MYLALEFHVYILIIKKFLILFSLQKCPLMWSSSKLLHKISLFRGCVLVVSTS